MYVKQRQECLSLKVNPSQSGYIASNENSLNETQENAGIARPFAIYIDKPLQGKGYGHLALKEIIQYFKDNGADIITLSKKPSNKTALSLYHQFGFEENRAVNNEEIILKLHL